MASLADLPHLIGFFSYSRNDDEGDDGAVSALANRVYRELRTQLGRNAENFKLWRDKDALAAGEQWQEKLKEAVSESVFFIMMVSPSTLNSPYCRHEFDSFLERERELGRNDLVFPILYISVPELDTKPPTTAPVISIVEERQYVDWRGIRHQNVNSTEVKQTVEQFCRIIANKLRATWISPEERQALEEQKLREWLKEIEAKRRVEEEERTRLAEKKRQAEEQRAREEEKRQIEDEARKRAEVEARQRGELEGKLPRREEQRRTQLEQEPSQQVKPWLLPLIGAIGGALPMVVLFGLYLSDSGPAVTVASVAGVLSIIYALWGGAAGMLVPRFAILRAVAIPAIPTFFVGSIIVFGAGGGTNWGAALIGSSIFAVLGCLFICLAFWLHSLPPSIEHRVPPVAG